MDLRKLKTLVDLVAESGISELEITEAEGKVRIVKSSPVAPSAPMYFAAPQGALAVPQQSGPSVAAVAAPPASTTAETAVPAGNVIKSPMVGTFYRSPNPESEPFASIGRKIEKGDTVCIIEAMKLMNEIEADFPGTIREILVDNGQPVEYGQPLMIVA